MKKYSFISLLIIFILFMCFTVVEANESIHPVLNRVVMIISLDENYQPLGIGSGFIVGNDGEIATNYHVIEGASSAIVKFVNKKKKYDVVSILQRNIKHDLAIIKIDTKISPVTLGDDELTSIGDRIFAIGNPEGLEGTVSEGIISGFRKINESFRLMQITAPISPGSSGGPVVNLKGEVIGVASASIVIGQNLNFAIPVKNLKELLSAPKLNLTFSRKNLPSVSLKQFESQTKPTDLVKAFNIERHTTYVGGSANISFSLRNNSRRDIRYVKVLIVWKSKSGVMLHFSPILVKDIIPSKHTKTISRSFVEGVGNLPYDFKADARIIDRGYPLSASNFFY